MVEEADKAYVAHEPVFHDGELALQRLIGLEERMDRLGRRSVRDYMPNEHRSFFESLDFVYLSALDKDGYPCVLVRAGAPGFMTSPDAKTLVIRSHPLASEPEKLALGAGDKVGLLGIELASRRRNRMNATIQEATGDRLTLSVDQSFGNCPKYIQTRQVEATGVSPRQAQGAVLWRDRLEAEDRELLAQADTLFIGSRTPDLSTDPRSGLDVSHRGGKPGFIEITNDREIVIPDFKGNNFYNTFGNIMLDARIGVQVPDFRTGSLLSLKGQGKVVMGDTANLTPPDEGRRLKISIEAVSCVENLLPFHFTFLEYSPML